MLDPNLIRELKKQSKKLTEKDIERAEAFESLVKTPGWQMFVELINIQVNQRSQQLLQPIAHGGRDASEHNKGAIYGLIFARDLVDVTIGAVKAMQKSDGQSDEENSDA